MSLNHIKTKPTKLNTKIFIVSVFIFFLVGCQSISKPTYTMIKAPSTTQTNLQQNSKGEKMTPHRLILVHGLHRSARVMKPLAKNLTESGFSVYSFEYPSTRATLQQHSNELNKWLMQNHEPKQPLYLVGHSLGGLVIRDFLSRYPQWNIANVVTLGTPHQGSISADYSEKIADSIVGKAYKNGLDGNTPPLAENINLGIIAGTKPFGIGTLLLSYHNRTEKMKNKDQTSDGTVYLSETPLKNAKDYLVVPINHTGLVKDKAVAKQVVHFLHHAKFIR